MARLSGENIDHYMNLRWSYRPESNRQNDLTRIAVSHLLTVAKNGAGDRDRTCDIRLTRAALCQLSYTGIKWQVRVESNHRLPFWRRQCYRNTSDP